MILNAVNQLTENTNKNMDTQFHCRDSSVSSDRSSLCCPPTE
jgi:hypothetical protein